MLRDSPPEEQAYDRTGKDGQCVDDYGKNTNSFFLFYAAIPPKVPLLCQLLREYAILNKVAIIEKESFYVYVPALCAFYFCCRCTVVRHRSCGQEPAGHVTNLEPAVCTQPVISLYTGRNDLCHQHAAAARADPAPPLPVGRSPGGGHRWPRCADSCRWPRTTCR